MNKDVNKSGIVLIVIGLLLIHSKDIESISLGMGMLFSSLILIGVNRLSDK